MSTPKKRSLSEDDAANESLKIAGVERRADEKDWTNAESKLNAMIRECEEMMKILAMFHSLFDDLLMVPFKVADGGDVWISNCKQTIQMMGNELQLHQKELNDLKNVKEKPINFGEKIIDKIYIFNANVREFDDLINRSIDAALNFQLDYRENPYLMNNENFKNLREAIDRLDEKFQLRLRQSDYLHEIKVSVNELIRVAKELKSENAAVFPQIEDRIHQLFSKNKDIEEKYGEQKTEMSKMREILIKRNKVNDVDEMREKLDLVASKMNEMIEKISFVDPESSIYSAKRRRMMPTVQFHDSFVLENYDKLHKFNVSVCLNEQRDGTLRLDCFNEIYRPDNPLTLREKKQFITFRRIYQMKDFDFSIVHNGLKRAFIKEAITFSINLYHCICRFNFNISQNPEDLKDTYDNDNNGRASEILRYFQLVKREPPISLEQAKILFDRETDEELRKLLFMFLQPSSELRILYQQYKKGRYLKQDLSDFIGKVGNLN